MNAFGWALLWMSVPITLVASAALVLERLVSRRGPVAASWVLAASLLVIVFLTPLAISGLPDAWSWRMSFLGAGAGAYSGKGLDSSGVSQVRHDANQVADSGEGPRQPSRVLGVVAFAPRRCTGRDGVDSPGPIELAVDLGLRRGNRRGRQLGATASWSLGRACLPAEESFD